MTCFLSVSTGYSLTYIRRIKAKSLHMAVNLQSVNIHHQRRIPVP
jgi:hypothetical protein